MKQKLIIGLALLLLLAAVFFMVKDFFFDEDKNQKNPYEYDLSEHKKVEDNLICFDETEQIDLQLETIKGISIDQQDNVYISGDEKIVVYNKLGDLELTIDLKNLANCLTISSEGIIFVGISDHVEVWSGDGKLIKAWEPYNEKSLITSLVVTESSVFVADAGNKIVHHYNLEGEHQNTIGRRNKEKGIDGFVIPSPYFDLLIGREGELWVVNPGRHQFESYSPQGELISSWKRTSMQLDGFSGCCNPSHAAMLSNGSFVTSEKGIERVKVHLPSGDFNCVVASPDQFEEETRGLDLAVDSKDRIFVLDPMKKNIRIFEEKN